MTTNALSVDTLSSLVGTWQGQGHVLNAAGETVATYVEQASLELLRRTDTAVVYRHWQQTRHAVVPDKPMHAETGFIKLDLINDHQTATGSFAHPFPSGFVQEMAHGTWTHDNDASCLQITLDAKDFQRAAVAAAADDKKQVQGFRRVYTYSGKDDTLSYEQYLSTSAGGDNLYHHLTCSMTRKS